MTKYSTNITTIFQTHHGAMSYCHDCDRFFDLWHGTQHSCDDVLASTPERNVPMLGKFSALDLMLWGSHHGLVLSSYTEEQARNVVKQIYQKPNGELDFYDAPGSFRSRIDEAKAKYICLPLTPDTPYWDYPATVGLHDGVQERQLLWKEQVLGKLECGPTGRFFVYPQKIAEWFEATHENYKILNIGPEGLREVDLLRIFRVADSGKPPISSSDPADCLVVHLLAPEIPYRLEPFAPLDGFEQGFARTVPKEYMSTYTLWQGVRDIQEELAENAMWAQDVVLWSGKLSEEEQKLSRTRSPYTEMLNRYWGYKLGAPMLGLMINRLSRVHDYEQSLWRKTRDGLKNFKNN